MLIRTWEQGSGLRVPRTPTNRVAINVLVPPRLGTRAYGSVPPALWPNDREAMRKSALKEDGT